MESLLPFIKPLIINLHHKMVKGNYGLYFRIWDRLMGTEQPGYIAAYDAIQERRFGKVKGKCPALE